MNVTIPNPNPELEARREALAKLLASRGRQSMTEHPVSRGQQALWFLHEAAPDSPAYTIVFALRLRGALDRPALERALQRLVDRHQQLRTSFHMLDDGRLVQRTHGYRDVTLPLAGAEEALLEETLTAAAAKPFDLAAGPLFRPELFRLAEDDHALLVCVHHIIHDGWSLWLVMDELRQAYQAETNATETGWDALPMSYTDHIAAQEALIGGAEGKRLAAFWKSRLATVQGTLDLPLDHPRAPIRSGRGAAHRFALDRASSAALGKLARDLGTTSFSLLLGAYQILLARYSGQQTIPVGTRSAGRRDGNAAGVVGYFVNPVVVVGRVARDANAADLLRATHAEVQEVLAHDDLPFPTIVEQLQLRRDPSTTPLFQASFVLQKAQRGGGAMELMAGRADWAGLEADFVDIAQQLGQFDLDLEMFEVGDSLRGVFKYDAALFEPQTIARLAENFVTLLEGLGADADRAIDDLPVLGAGSAALIAGFSAPVAAPVTATRCVHEAFEAQAARNPGAVALVCDGRTMTYG